MADGNEKETTSGGLRFRLPRLFAESHEEAEAPAAEPAQPAGRPAKGGTQPAPVKAAPAANAVRAADSAPAAMDRPQQAPVQRNDNLYLQHATAMMEELRMMQQEMQQLHQVVIAINERETAQEKVFNTLHAELREYKTDFIYEHMKPVVRPLLFLFDSLEQFDAEIALYERPNQGERRQTGLAPQLVRENIGFFRDQLVEALRICEVTPMETPTGPFNPKLHKVIDVVPVDADQDSMIQRVVRSGWYLNAQLLRPAEVIVGKKM